MTLRFFKWNSIRTSQKRPRIPNMNRLRHSPRCMKLLHNPEHKLSQLLCCNLSTKLRSFKNPALLWSPCLGKRIKSRPRDRQLSDTWTRVFREPSFSIYADAAERHTSERFSQKFSRCICCARRGDAFTICYGYLVPRVTRTCKPSSFRSVMQRVSIRACARACAADAKFRERWQMWEYIPWRFDRSGFGELFLLRQMWHVEYFGKLRRTFREGSSIMWDIFKS